jgi:hypothetical protein
LGITPIQSRDMQWVTRATFTTYDSEVKEMPVPSFRPPLSGFGGLGTTFIEVGKPLTQIIAFGLNPDSTRTATQVQVGNSAADFRMGFVNDFTYKSLNFSFVLDWQQGGNVIDLTTFLYDDGSNAKDYGTPEWEERYNCYLKGAMTCYMGDATFLKIRSEHRHRAAQNWVNALGWGVDNVRLSVTGRTLATFTSYIGLDPEVANFGAAAIRNNLDVAQYPPSRAVFFNISVGF